MRADTGGEGCDPSGGGSCEVTGVDGLKYKETARDNGGTPEKWPENERQMISNTGWMAKGNMGLTSDNGGKSAWLNGKESGVMRRPGH